MSITFKTLIIPALTLSALCMTSTAHAVPWCHKGSIVQVANIQLNGTTLTSMAAGLTVPAGVTNPAYYSAFTVGSNMCSTYAGGGGFGNVPGKGTVQFIPYAPYSFTNGFNYNLAEGLSFKCHKCYAIAPMSQIKFTEKEMFAKPLEGLEAIEKYITSPNRGGK